MIYRVKYEDRDLDELVGDPDVFSSKRQAMACVRQVVANPDADLGSVYVTEDDGYDERVIAGRMLVSLPPDAPCR